MSQGSQSDPHTRVGAESEQFSTNGVKSFSRDGSPSNKFGEAAAPLVNSPVDTGASRVEVPEAGRLVSKLDVLETIDAVATLVRREAQDALEHGNILSVKVAVERLQVLESAACAVACARLPESCGPNPYVAANLELRERCDQQAELIEELRAELSATVDEDPVDDASELRDALRSVLWPKGDVAANDETIILAVRDKLREAAMLRGYETFIENLKIHGADAALRQAMWAAITHIEGGRENYAVNLLRKIVNGCARGQAEEPEAKPSTIRPLLNAFVGAMEDRLRARDRSGDDWLEDSPQDHLERIQSNAQRLWGNVATQTIDSEQVASDAADVANFAAFLFNRAHPEFTDRGRKVVDRG